MGYMIGVDVGGTFTDFSVFNLETGELFHYKDSLSGAWNDGRYKRAN